MATRKAQIYNSEFSPLFSMKIFGFETESGKMLGKREEVVVRESLCVLSGWT